MRLIGIKTLKVGDVLAMPVSTLAGKVILNSGVSLSTSYIEKLKQLRIHNVYIEDERFNDVEVVQAMDFKTMNKALQVLKDTHEAFHKGKAFDEYLILDVSKGIIDYVKESKDKGVSILSTNAIENHLIGHSINVAILTAYIANRMDYNYNQLCNLITGALVHDIGRENASEEKPEHTQKGFDVMRKCKGLSLHSSIVCYEHHENFDGTGYPRKIKGDGISEFTRAIRVADLYDDILHGYENDSCDIMPHQAFEHILAASGNVLDPSIVKTFRDTIVFYPNGCTVSLSNGVKGVVIKQNHGSPQRPVVRSFDYSKVIDEIDLLKNLTLFVEDVVIV